MDDIEYNCATFNKEFTGSVYASSTIMRLTNIGTNVHLYLSLIMQLTSDNCGKTSKLLTNDVSATAMMSGFSPSTNTPSS